MEFKADQFMSAEFKHRTEAVPVPDLAAFFDLDEEEKAVWVVRGLTANELAQANEAEQKNRKVSVLIEALTNTNKHKSKRVEDVQKALGLSSDVHAEVAKRLEMLVLGSVEPSIPLEIAVRLAEVKPIEFYQLTNVILQLTGKGQDYEGKSKPSGETE